MSAKINKDGTIEFGKSKGLLSISDITRQAIAVLADMEKKRMAWEEMNRVNELRKSCGAAPKTITIRADFSTRKPAGHGSENV